MTDDAMNQPVTLRRPDYGAIREETTDRPTGRGGFLGLAGSLFTSSPSEEVELNTVLCGGGLVRRHEFGPEDARASMFRLHH